MPSASFSVAMASSFDSQRNCASLRIRRGSPALPGANQVYTCADLTRLREAGYNEPMLTLEEGVERYCHALLNR